MYVYTTFDSFSDTLVVPENTHILRTSNPYFTLETPERLRRSRQPSPAPSAVENDDEDLLYQRMDGHPASASSIQNHLAVTDENVYGRIESSIADDEEMKPYEQDTYVQYDNDETMHRYVSVYVISM